MYRLVVGLGNPGSEYNNTKHNIAWMLFDKLAELSNANWKTKFKGIYTEITVQGEKVVFLKPQTYMNLSGESVQPLAAFFKINPEEILVVHDELDIALGMVQFRMGGGLAGHNGLKSLAACLGTDNFARMRVGIGRPVHGSVSDWVLSPFPKEQQIDLAIVLDKLPTALQECVKEEVGKASQKWNKKNLLGV